MGLWKVKPTTMKFLCSVVFAMISISPALAESVEEVRSGLQNLQAASKVNNSLEMSRQASYGTSDLAPRNQKIDGWIVFQVQDGRKTDFNRLEWKEYKEGFGKLESGVYWMGLERLHQYTTTGKWQLLVRVVNKNKPYSNQLQWAIFNNFKIDEELLRYSLKIGSKVRVFHGHDFNIQNSRDWPFRTPNDAFDQSSANTYEGGFWFCDNPNTNPIPCPTCTDRYVHSLMALRKMPEK